MERQANTIPRVLMFLLLAALSFGGCKGEITDDDLQMWTHNEEGFRQIETIMVDGEVSNDIRTRALYFLVKADQGGKIGRMFRKSTGAQPLAIALRDKLTKDLAAEGLDAVRAKNGLLTLLQWLPEEQQEPVRKLVAEWAFKGLSEESTTEQIRTQVEQRIGIGDIGDLGIHGGPGAALLISRGFWVTPLFEYLESFKDDKTRKILLEALKKYEALPEINITKNQLSRIYGIGTVEAASHLMSIYRTLGEEDEDLALEAFNAAQELLAQESIRKQKGKVIAAIAPLLEVTNPDDRWYAATQLLQLEGASQLDHVFAALKDDGIYANGVIDPQKSIIDLCRTAVEPLGKEAFPKVRTLVAKGNRVQKVVGLICTKVSANTLDKKLIKRLKRSKTNIAPILGRGFTVKSLTENVSSGVKYISQLKADLKAKKIKKDEYDSKLFFAIVTLDKSGKDFVTEVESRYADVKAEEEEAAQ